jgi:hypothetical protein
MLELFSIHFGIVFPEEIQRERKKREEWRERDMCAMKENMVYPSKMTEQPLLPNVKVQNKHTFIENF